MGPRPGRRSQPLVVVFFYSALEFRAVLRCFRRWLAAAFITPERGLFRVKVLEVGAPFSLWTRQGLVERRSRCEAFLVLGFLLNCEPLPGLWRRESEKWFHDQRPVRLPALGFGGCKARCVGAVCCRCEFESHGKRVREGGGVLTSHAICVPWSVVRSSPSRY